MIYAAAVLLLLGLAALAASGAIDPAAKGLARAVGIGAIVFSVGVGVAGAAVSVPAGHVGVPTLFGKVQDYTLPEGFHIINPLAEVHAMSIRTQQFTMSAASGGQLTAMSSDQLTMTMDVTVTYFLNAGQAQKIYRLLGDDYATNIVQPAVRTAIRDAVRQYTAVDAVSSRREELGARMVSLVKRRMERQLTGRELPSYGITVQDVLLRNIALPGSLSESIARVQQQRQAANERQQAIETARQEAERARIEAEGAARVAQVNAERDANVRLIGARAEAEANRVVAASITEEILTLRAIEATREITSSDQTRTVILGGGESDLPLIMNMGQN